MSAVSPIDTVNVYVAGLPLDWSESELLTLFSTHGTIEGAKILHDEATKKSRGVGFVKFKELQAAQQAIKTLNGTW